MSKLSFSVLRVRNFRLLLLTRMFASMAWQAQAVIVGWQIYSLTHNLFLLGLTGLTEAVPALACALFAGHIVDISKPQRVYRYCQIALMFNMLILLFIAGGFVAAPGGSILPWIFGGVFVAGIIRSFLMPSSFAMLSRVAARADISAASAWLSTGFQIAVISGPAMVGLIYGGYGVRAAWLMPAFLVIIAVIMSIFIEPTHPREPAKREPTVKAIKAGWSFILKNPVMLSMMALDMFAVLFGGAVAMLPAYADQVLHIGPQGLGALRAAPAFGAMLTAAVFSVKPMRRLSAARLMWVIAGFGVSIIGFGLSKIFGLSLIFLALSGAFDSVGMIIRGTLMQLLTPDNMRGRVSSVNSMFIISSNELGAFESGTLAHLIGVVPSVVAGGIATLMIVALTALISPQFRRTVVETDETA